MSKVAISVRGLGKRYRRGQTIRHDALREVITETLRYPLRLFRGAKSPAIAADDHFWAVRDISFDVSEGEVLGIIGHNGAGKSTLLKLLTRITAPTEGYAEIRGRVGSLLEVGTGFHPELTGRENVYLNGTILGLTQTEIRRKFDEIVDFAGVEAFIDTPVKRYSSGMQMRLAFAVAAHLEPEVLLIDEVLAVGDAAFRKKSLGKMGEVARQGRTILFVSHNMAAVDNLCDRIVYLKEGRVQSIGCPNEMIRRYLSEVDKGASGSVSERRDRNGSGALRITNISLLNADREPVPAATCGETAYLRLDYVAQEALANINVAIGIDSLFGQRVCLLDSKFTDQDFSQLPSKGSIICELRRLGLVATSYDLTVCISNHGVVADWIQSAYRLVIEQGDFFGTGFMPQSHDGVMLMQQNWSSEG